MDIDAKLYRARNGDTLDALNAQMKEADEQVSAARWALMQAESKLVPFREALHEAEMTKSNIACRLNILWHEIRWDRAVRRRL